MPPIAPLPPPAPHPRRAPSGTIRIDLSDLEVQLPDLALALALDFLSDD